MNIIKVISKIRKSETEHFLYVDKRTWIKWGLIIDFFVFMNKNYIPCRIYRKKYKFLENIVVIGLKWNGKNVKRRTSGIAKEFLKDNLNAKCIYCDEKLNDLNATTDHIIPISEGGNNCQINLVIVCFDCNNQRGNLEFNEYMDIKNPYNKKKYI